MTAIKFCGLSRAEDVREAVRLGVDFVGLNFVPESPRYVSPDCGAALVDSAHEEAAASGLVAPAFVGVFSGSSDGAVERALECCPLNYLQWHGPLGMSPPGDLPLILALRLRPGEPVPEPLPGGAWAYLLDAYHERLLGGIGLRADWELAAMLAGRCRLFLAGGLRPNNVAGAVAAVTPYGVDVASGIESAPGIKDHALMRAFVEEVRRADGIA